MSLRYLIQAVFALFLTLVSQYYISLFNEYLHAAKAEITVLEHIKETEGIDNDHFREEIEILHYDLHHASIDLFDAMLISGINLMFPIDYLI